MFVSIPPKEAPELSSGQGKDSHKKPELRPRVISRQLCAAVAWQVLSGLFTLMPWTKLPGSTFAGYQPMGNFEGIYDGLAGSFNLIASAFFILGSVPVLLDRTQQSVSLYSYFIVGWNLILSVWLLVLHSEIGHAKSYGLTLTFGAALGVIICAVAAIIVRRKAQRNGW